MTYEHALNETDERLRLMAECVRYVADVIDLERAAKATVHGSGEVGVVVSWQRGGDPDPGALRSAYASCDDDPLAPRHHLSGDRNVVAVLRAADRLRVQRTSYARDVLGPAGLKVVAAMYLRFRGRMVAVVKAFRRLDAPDLTQPEVRSLNQLHPLLESAYGCSLGEPRMMDPQDLLASAAVATSPNAKPKRAKAPLKVIGAKKKAGGVTG